MDNLEFQLKITRITRALHELELQAQQIIAANNAINMLVDESDPYYSLLSECRDLAASLAEQKSDNHSVHEQRLISYIKFCCHKAHCAFHQEIVFLYRWLCTTLMEKHLITPANFASTAGDQPCLNHIISAIGPAAHKCKIDDEQHSQRQKLLPGKKEPTADAPF